MARNFNVKDEALTAQIRDGQAKVFAEDMAVLEAQQRNLLLHPKRRLLLLNIDAGGAQSRRLLDKMIAAEQAAQQPAAQAA
jgi:vanillate O-demethylase monooxygenase subunit